MGVQGVALLVGDSIYSEESVFYDMEYHQILESSMLIASVDKFRAAVRQHAMKGQFELGTEKSYKHRFRGY
jgi:hypothetical protein